MVTYSIEVIENTVKATFEADVKAKLDVGYIKSSGMVITDDGVTRTYAIMLEKTSTT